MDLSKSREYFDPSKISERIHIIGCGSVGSTIAENLARCGITKMTLWDFDVVEEHNIVNQMFRIQDVNKPKVEALKDIIVEINPEAEKDIILEPKGWQGKTLSGYIFLAVDSIEVRRKIVEECKDNIYVKAIFDVRTLLEGAQHFAADWSNYEQQEDLLNSMQFTDEEGDAEVPVSACGVTLGVATTVRLISAYCVNNFINFANGKPIKKLMIMDGFNFIIHAF